MDDYLGGAETVEEAIELINNVITVHKKADFDICNWICNSNDVLEHINSHRKTEPSPKIKIGDNYKDERVLGMWWNYQTDTFSYLFKFHKVHADILTLTRRPTKRDLLKVVMSIFDPLGLLTNFTVVGKILLQSVWDSGIDWDDPLLDNDYDIWVEWCKNLSLLVNYSIPRQFTTLPLRQCTTQLHIFCDASKYAYAACAYLRFEFDGKIDCILVMSKSRVAPLKPTSIPRLELQGALTGARLAKYLKSSLDVKIEETFLWSDSEVVLNWIKSSSRRFKVYVAQRLGEIHELTNTNDWRYVPSKLNISDEATKIGPISFDRDSPWIKGPKFLYLGKTEWPDKRFLHTDQLDDEQVQKEYVNVTSIKESSLPDVTRFSKWSKFLRTTAWVLRFVRLLKSRSRPVTAELHPNEISEAEVLIYKEVQFHSFSTEIENLNNGKVISNKSQLRSFPLFLSNDGILRLKGRLDNVDDPDYDFNAKNPIMLDSKHPVTSLIIRHYHEQNNHIGHESIIQNLRRIYWITGCRNAVKKSAYQCQFCKIQKAKPMIPMIAQLPSCRINPTLRPFIKTGVDLFGPIEITVKRSHEKRYGVIFTCMTTRAIHLEIAEDLTSNAFINAWRRFGSRRGFPEEIYSDNGTNFVKANKEINEAINDWPHDDITKTMTMKNCKWFFNPPAAPHMGGAWERLIQSVKKHLKVMLHEKFPKEVTLRTLFCEIENIINSRPLTHVPLNSNDDDPLTPNDLLIGPCHKSLQFAQTDDKDLTVLSMWKSVQRLTDIFWTKWKNIYRQHILYSWKWSKDNQNLKKDDVVLVINPDGPRNIWPKGIVIKIYPSSDGRVRIVDVKTAHGTYRRPVTKIIKLDVNK